MAFALVHLAHTILDAPGDSEREAIALLERADDVARRAQNPRCQAWAAWGRGRLALAAGDAAAAVQESQRAVTFLQDREFPWARAELWTFLAESADLAGQRAVAEEACDHARSLALNRSATRR